MPAYLVRTTKSRDLAGIFSADDELDLERVAEKKRAREWAEDEVKWAMREVAANMLRIIRGAGKPYEILLQMKSAIDAAVRFKELHGYWPNDMLAHDLRLTSKDDEYWEGQREGRSAFSLGLYFLGFINGRWDRATWPRRLV